MKILHIIDSMGLGGAQTLVKGIFESQKNNDNIFLFSLREKNVKIDIDHSNFIIFKSNKKYSFKPLKELKGLIKKENIDILHCHLFRSQVFGFLLKRFYFKDINLVFHEHGEIFTNNFIYNLFLKLVKSKVDLFLAVSNATKENLIKYGKIEESKIKVLYNFVDPKRFNKDNITWSIKEEREKIGIKNDEFVIGFAGRLSSVKGCEYLIRALTGLNFKYKCLIAGEGPLKKDLEKLTKELKLENKIFFLGYQNDIMKFYSLINLFIMPSLSEGGPMTFYEAQQLGVPTIGSNVSSINEFIIDNKNGLLFEAKNSDSLSEKIKLVYKNIKLREKLIKNGLEEVKRYSLSEYLEKLNKIYLCVKK